MTPEHIKFINELHKNIHDHALWKIYADWLQIQEDIRGELITLELTIQEQDNPEIQNRIQEIYQQEIAIEAIEEQKNLFAGKDLLTLTNLAYFTEVENSEWHSAVEFKLKWQYNFIKKARIGTLSYDWEGPEIEECIQVLFSSPAAYFLEELTIGAIPGDGELEYQSVVDKLISLGERKSLQKLYIGDFQYSDDTEISWSSIGNTADLYALYPNLKYLHLQGGNINLGELHHEKLEFLKLETGGLPLESVQAIDSAYLPNLHTMEIWFGSSYYGAGGNINNLTQLLTGKNYPKLKNLGLKNSEFSNDIPLALANSALLSQLETLDLSMGVFHEVGAKQLIALADKFQHLNFIDLSQNYIPPATAKTLQKVFGNKINILEQEKPDEYDGEMSYYVSVGE